MINDWSKNNCVTLFTLGWIDVTAIVQLVVFESDTIRLSVADQNIWTYISTPTRRIHYE